MKSLTKNFKIKATIENVWDALTNPKIINKWGGGPAEMDSKINFKFKLWGGDIWGTNTKVVTNKLLIQDWYSGKWDKASTVQFKLVKDKEFVNLTLSHSNIPDKEFLDIKSGWDDYYLNPLKELLEAKL